MYALFLIIYQCRESEATLEGYETALFHFKRLTEIDSIRVKSWIRRIESVKILIEQLLLSEDNK